MYYITKDNKVFAPCNLRGGCGIAGRCTLALSSAESYTLYDLWQKALQE